MLYMCLLMPCLTPHSGADGVAFTALLNLTHVVHAEVFCGAFCYHLHCPFICCSSTCGDCVAHSSARVNAHAVLTSLCVLCCKLMVWHKCRVCMPQLALGSACIEGQEGWHDFPCQCDPWWVAQGLLCGVQHQAGNMLSSALLWSELKLHMRLLSSAVPMQPDAFG